MTIRRKRQPSINRLVDKAQQPTFVLNEARQVIAFNPAFEAWLGEKHLDSLEEPLHFGTSSAPDKKREARSFLCPPPSLLDCGQGSYLIRAYDIAKPNLDEATFKATVVAFTDEKNNRTYLVSVDLISVDGNSEGSDTSTSTDVAFDIAKQASRESAKLHAQLIAFRKSHPAHHAHLTLLGDSPNLKKARKQIDLLLSKPCNVLLTAAPGFRADALAKSLFYETQQLSEAGPIVPIECGLMDPELLQATVIRNRRWLQEQQREVDTATGWFLLSDVEKLDGPSQQELLGLLQLPDFDLPTIATTSQSLSQLLNSPSFDSTLAILLSDLTIEIPPLASRREDIPLVAQALLEEQNLNAQKQFEGFTTDAMDRLWNHSWARNIDELSEVIQFAREHAKQSHISTSDFPKHLDHAESAATFARDELQPIDLNQFLEQIEQQLIERALQVSDGNKTKAAELLGISRAKLHRKVDGSNDSDEVQ